MKAVQEWPVQLGASGTGNPGIAAGVVQVQVDQELQESSYLRGRHVQCVWDGGVLTLRGQVSSYYQKQMAQVLAHQVLARQGWAQRRRQARIALRNDVEVVHAPGTLGH